MAAGSSSMPAKICCSQRDRALRSSGPVWTMSASPGPFAQRVSWCRPAFPARPICSLGPIRSIGHPGRPPIAGCLRRPRRRRAFCRRQLELLLRAHPPVVPVAGRSTTVASRAAMSTLTRTPILTRSSVSLPVPNASSPISSDTVNPPRPATPGPARPTSLAFVDLGGRTAAVATTSSRARQWSCRRRARRRCRGHRVGEGRAEPAGEQRLGACRGPE
jgi:hypothetical protein